MKRTRHASFVASVFACGFLGTTAFAQTETTNTPDPDLPGRQIYEQFCAACHDNPADTRAASFEAISALSGEALYGAISEGGVMAPMGAALSLEEKISLIEYLTSGQSAVPGGGNWTTPIMCEADNLTVNLDGPEAFTTFGVDQDSTRHVSAQQSGLTTGDMSELDVAWVLAFPESQNFSAAPVSVGQTIFINGDGVLAAFDAEDACVKWTYEASASRSPITYGEIDGRAALLYGVGRREVHAVDALTGDAIWAVEAQPRRGDGGSIRPGVILHDNKVIVPISASGVGGGGNFCCTGHGAVVVLNASDGSWVWEYHTMDEATENGQVNSRGEPQRGPSGAPIWSQPTVDTERNQVIVTTGEGTSFPATNTSDAIIALDLDTGTENWVFQAMEMDLWNMHCRGDDSTAGPNCPWHWDDENIGRDFDFGGSAILATTEIDGEARDILLAGQKSGHLWAIDAETGDMIWNRQVGEGTALGGNHWGIAIDGERAFLTINDPVSYNTPNPHPGIYAFRISDGEMVWGFDAEPDCDDGRADRITNCEQKYGFSATPMVVDGAVIAGTLDGKIYAFDAETGDILYQLDTAIDFETLNGFDGNGGSIDSHAIAAGNGRLLIGSGYASFRQTAGNVLIALEPVD